MKRAQRKANFKKLLAQDGSAAQDAKNIGENQTERRITRNSKQKVSNSVSPYFINDNHQSSSSQIEKCEKDKGEKKDIPEKLSKLENDSDFLETPVKKIKRAPKLSQATKNKSTKGSKRPKKQPSIKSALLRNEQIFSEIAAQHCLADSFSPDEVQMAIAISRSEVETNLDSEDFNSAGQAEEKQEGKEKETTSESIRSKLQKYGFRTAAQENYSYCLAEAFFPGKRRLKTKWANKFTALTLRNPEMQTKKLNEKINTILAHQFRSNSKIVKNQSAEPYCVHSSLLTKYSVVDPCHQVLHNVELRPSNNYPLEKYFIEDIFPVSRLPKGHLLKDWRSIPGRDLSPKRLSDLNRVSERNLKKFYKALEKIELGGELGEDLIEEEEGEKENLNHKPQNGLEKPTKDEKTVSLEEKSNESTEIVNNPFGAISSNELKRKSLSQFENNSTLPKDVIKRKCPSQRLNYSEVPISNFSSDEVCEKNLYPNKSNTSESKDVMLEQNAALALTSLSASADKKIGAATDTEVNSNGSVFIRPTSPDLFADSDSDIEVQGETKTYENFSSDDVKIASNAGCEKEMLSVKADVDAHVDAIVDLTEDDEPEVIADVCSKIAVEAKTSLPTSEAMPETTVRAGKPAKDITEKDISESERLQYKIPLIEALCLENQNATEKKELKSKTEKRNRSLNTFDSFNKISSFAEDLDDNGKNNSFKNSKLENSDKIFGNNSAGDLEVSQGKDVEQSIDLTQSSCDDGESEDDDDNVCILLSDDEVNYSILKARSIHNSRDSRKKLVSLSKKHEVNDSPLNLIDEEENPISTNDNCPEKMSLHDILKDPLDDEHMKVHSLGGVKNQMSSDSNQIVCLEENQDANVDENPERNSNNLSESNSKPIMHNFSILDLLDEGSSIDADKESPEKNIGKTKISSRSFRGNSKFLQQSPPKPSVHDFSVLDLLDEGDSIDAEKESPGKNLRKIQKSFQSLSSKSNCSLESPQKAIPYEFSILDLLDGEHSIDADKESPEKDFGKSKKSPRRFSRNSKFLRESPPKPSVHDFSVLDLLDEGNSIDAEKESPGKNLRKIQKSFQSFSSKSNCSLGSPQKVIPHEFSNLHLKAKKTNQTFRSSLSEKNLSILDLIEEDKNTPENEISSHSSKSANKSCRNSRRRLNLSRESLPKDDVQNLSVVELDDDESSSFDLSLRDEAVPNPIQFLVPTPRKTLDFKDSIKQQRAEFGILESQSESFSQTPIKITPQKEDSPFNISDCNLELERQFKRKSSSSRKFDNFLFEKSNSPSIHHSKVDDAADTLEDDFDEFDRLVYGDPPNRVQYNEHSRTPKGLSQLLNGELSFQLKPSTPESVRKWQAKSVEKYLKDQLSSDSLAEYKLDRRETPKRRQDGKGQKKYSRVAKDLSTLLTGESSFSEQTSQLINERNKLRIKTPEKIFSSHKLDVSTLISPSKHVRLSDHQRTLKDLSKIFMDDMTFFSQPTTPVDTRKSQGYKRKSRTFNGDLNFSSTSGKESSSKAQKKSLTTSFDHDEFDEFDRMVYGDVDPLISSFNCNKKTPQKFAKTNHEAEEIVVNNYVYRVRVTNSPKPKFAELSESEILKQLYNFGIKPLKRNQAVKLLEYIYNETHPIIEPGAVTRDECQSPEKTEEARETAAQEDEGTEKVCLSKKFNLKDCHGDMLLRFSTQLFPETLKDDEIFIFQTNITKKTMHPLLPLHIAWYNLVCSCPELHESILMFEPIDLQEIFNFFKSIGCRYDPKDLKTFFDHRCIIFRFDVNKTRNRRHIRSKSKQELKKLGEKTNDAKQLTLSRFLSL